MTDMWKCEEKYVFDIPSTGRLIDVYWKSMRTPHIEWYIKYFNPKVTKVEFGSHYACVECTVGIPKHPEQ